MAFTVNDYQDLVRLLDEHPEWQTELRRLLLTDDFIALPESMRRLTERVEALAEAQLQSATRLDRLEALVEKLVEAQARTEARLETLTERMDALTQRVDALVEEIRALTEQIVQLVEVQGVQGNRLASLYGDLLEFRYRDKAVSYFGQLLRKPQVVSLNDLWDALEQQLTPEELDDVLLVDLLVQGRPRSAPDGPEICLVLEVSGVVDRVDVERAQRRASLLQKIGFVTIAAVAGENYTRGANELLGDRAVVSFSNGRSHGWEAALAVLKRGD